MAERNNPNPDPIAVRATQAAIAATEPPVRNHPWIRRLTTVAAAILILVGVVSLVIGAVNSARINSTIHDLKKSQNELAVQQQCIATLQKAVGVEQKARADIAADDRKALSDLVHNVSNAKTSDDVKAAFRIFDEETAKNDKRRAQYPVPSFNSSVCNITHTQDSLPVSSPTPASSATTGSSTSNGKTSPNSKVKKSTHINAEGKVIVTTVTPGKPKPAPPVTKPSTATRTVVQPGPTHTATKIKTRTTTAPAAKPTSVSVLGGIPIVGPILCNPGISILC